jgi:thiamine kinase-like enzyme
VDVAEVAALVRRVPGWEDAAPVVTALPGGITNQNFRVDIGRDSYVARLPGDHTELLGVDRAVEAEVARRAAALGIGPDVVGALPGHPTLITRLVPGQHADVDGFRAPPRLEAVVAAVRRLHASGPVAGAFPIHRIVERHARDAAAHGVAVPAAYDDLHRLSAAIEAAFAASPLPPVPCHNDLLPGNVLFDGDHVWLLDFEYAGMNERFFDLANLSVNAGLGPDDDDRVLAAYFDDVRPAHRARLELMKVLSELREGLWAVVQQAISTLDDFDFAAYAAERLASAERLGARAETGAWLTAVATATA